MPLTTLTPTQTLEKAFELIVCESVEILARSRFFNTSAFPPGSGPEFVNAAGKLRTSLNAQDLLAHLHDVEQVLGRTRQTRWEARICDIDLLSYGDVVLPDAKTYRYWSSLPLDQQMAETPEQLILPHPRLAERGFVLVPLADVASDWVHPVLKRSVADMVSDLPPEMLADITPIDG